MSNELDTLRQQLAEAERQRDDADRANQQNEESLTKQIADANTAIKLLACDLAAALSREERLNVERTAMHVALHDWWGSRVSSNPDDYATADLVLMRFCESLAAGGQSNMKEAQDGK